MRPFARRFALKASLVLTSIAILLVLPIPAKILIDHVILARPVEAERNPLVRVPLLWLGLTDPAPSCGAPAGLLVALLVLVGAIGPGGAEHEPTQAWLGGGQDIASQTENEINAGFSLVGGVLGLLDYFITIRLTQDLNHHYRTRLFTRIQALPYAAFDDARIGDAIYRVLYDTPAITNTAYRILLTPIGAPIAIVSSPLLLPLRFPGHPP